MNNRPDDEALKAMNESPYNFPSTRWAAYQNAALDSATCGHLQFLAIGPENTYKEKPTHFPDTNAGLGWKYQFVGWVNLSTGEITHESLLGVCECGRSC